MTQTSSAAAAKWSDRQEILVRGRGYIAGQIMPWSPAAGLACDLQCQVLYIVREFVRSLNPACLVGNQAGCCHYSAGLSV